MKKSAYNIISGIVSQTIAIALGVIIPRLVLVNLGSAANGLLSSVSQALVYIGLLEAGVGTATLQALYGPVADKDQTAISRILSATNQYYRKTGKIYFLLVVLFSLVFPLFVTSEMPYFTVFAVVLLSGLSGVISFFFQGKFNILLCAEGKNYIIINLATVSQIVFSITKIILLYSGFNVVAIQLASLSISTVQVLAIMIYIKRNYSWINLSEKPDYDAIAQKDSVMVHQLSGLIFNNTDTLVLTMFCGLKVASIYAMYTLLFSMIKTAISTISNSVTFKLGQTYNSNRNMFLKLHDSFELWNMVLTFSLYCIACVFILPFMQLYTAGVIDVNYIDQYLPYLFIATYLLSNGRTSSGQVINYAGHFKLTQWRSVIESVINVVVSVVCVNFWGIYGVLLGTIAALLYRTNDMILYANKRLLNRSPWITYRRWLVNLAVFVGVIAVSYQMPWTLDSYASIIGWAAVCCAVVIPLFVLAACIFDRKTIQLTIRYLKNILRKRQLAKQA